MRTHQLAPPQRPSILRDAARALACRLGWHRGPLLAPYTITRRGMTGRCGHCGRRGWWLP